MEHLQIDSESSSFLNLLSEQERVRKNRLPDIKTVLVVLSSRGMVYDTESLRRKITDTYAGARVYFRSTLGQHLGAEAPTPVDLLIDFTGPRQRQGWFYSKRLRKEAKFALGRNAGFFRKGDYDLIYDEKLNASKLPKDLLDRERFVQRALLESVGIPLSQSGEALPDLGKTIAVQDSGRR